MYFINTFKSYIINAKNCRNHVIRQIYEIKHTSLTNQWIEGFHFLSHFGSSNPCWHPKVTSFSCLRTSDTCIEDMQYTQNKFLINQWWVGNYIIWALPSCLELNWCTFVSLRCKFTKKGVRFKKIKLTTRGKRFF